MRGCIPRFKSIAEKYRFIFKTVYESSKWVFVTAVLSIVILASAPVITSTLLKNMVSLVEHIFSSHTTIPYAQLLLQASGYVFILMLQDIILSCRMVSYRVAGLNLTYNIQTKIVEKLKSIPYHMFYSPSFQNLYSNVLRGSDHEPLEIVHSTLSLCYMLLQITSLIGVIAYLNIWILLLLFICFIPNIVCGLKIQKENVNLWKSQIQNYRRMSYCFEQVTDKTSLKEVRLFNLFKYFETKRKAAFLDNVRVWKNFGKKELFATTLSQVVSKAGIFITIAWLLIKTVQKGYNVSQFVFYSNIIFMFQRTYIELINVFVTHYTSMLFMNQFFELLRIKSSINSGNELLQSKTRHFLEFVNVSFKYPYTDTYVLKNINLKLETGDVVCFVGENGSGKTTLANLILRVYEPTQGEILLDGKNIKDYDFEEYQKIFSAILQDHQKYSVLLKDSIAFGNLKKKGTLDELEQSGKLATADGFIKNLNKQYESNLTKWFDEDGEELSGGQWQKLAVARVFYSDADILIFDEPTSSVDPVSESEIYENIWQTKSKLIIFISHRMYASKNASRIVMMANGEINAIGTHEELLNNCEQYRTLFNSQAVKYTNLSHG